MIPVKYSEQSKYQQAKSESGGEFITAPNLLNNYTSYSNYKLCVLNIIVDYLQSTPNLFFFEFGSFQFTVKINLQRYESSLNLICRLSPHFITFISLYGNAVRLIEAALKHFNAAIKWMKMVQTQYALASKESFNGQIQNILHIWCSQTM